MPEESRSSNDIADQILEAQRRLYSYILTLVPDSDRAWDILQQTNLVLWRDSDRFSTGSSFMSWAFRVAYFQVLSSREKQLRDRLRFSGELLETLAAESVPPLKDDHSRLKALRECLEQLPAKQRGLLQSRYGDGRTVASIAESRGQAAGALSTYLHRIRRGLLGCIERRLAVESRS
ncbi:MAG: sigma-70 family RNA polymerase sigma factor [Pirellulales bacterium]|nr:sigma-70 family RNA polymerase sigma factor [Pirellulales bacterium]